MSYFEGSFNLACSEASSSWGEKRCPCSPVYGASLLVRRVEPERIHPLERRRFWNHQSEPALTSSTVFVKSDKKVEIRVVTSYELRSNNTFLRPNIQAHNESSIRTKLF